MVAGVDTPRAPVAEPSASGGLPTLIAAAQVVQQTGSVVHVVLARQPGIVERARRMGRAAGLDVFVDLGPCTIRVRLSPHHRA